MTNRIPIFFKDSSLLGQLTLTPNLDEAAVADDAASRALGQILASLARQRLGRRLPLPTGLLGADVERLAGLLLAGAVVVALVDECWTVRTGLFCKDRSLVNCHVAGLSNS